MHSQEKRRIEQPMDSRTEAGLVWLYGIDDDEFPYWESTSGTKKVRVFPPRPPLHAWLVQVVGTDHTVMCSGVNAERDAFVEAAALTQV